MKKWCRVDGIVGGSLSGPGKRVEKELEDISFFSNLQCDSVCAGVSPLRATDEDIPNVVSMHDGWSCD